MTLSFEVENENGIEVIELNVNSLPTTIRLRQFVDVNILVNEMSENVRALINDPEAFKTAPDADVIAYYRFCLEFLSILSDKDMETLAHLKISGENGFELLNVINTIFSNIQEYEPRERKEFKFKGQRYLVPHTAVTVFGKKLGAETTVIQNILAFELERVYEQKDADKNPIYKDGRYHSIIGVMACLCYEVLEDGKLDFMPINDLERDHYMARKIKTFSDVTMDIALDVDFFLLTSNPTLGNILNFVTHLRAKSPPA